MTEQKKCKHEWRQKFKSTIGAEPDYLYEDGYYCIHCLKHKKRKIEKYKEEYEDQNDMDKLL